MFSMRTSLSLALLLLFTTASGSRAADDPPVDFVRQIKPILTDRCVECHNSENLLGDLNLQNHEHAMAQRKGGPAILPHQPDKSLVYLALTLPAKEKKAMPATAHRLPHSDIETIKRWIKEGAAWPAGKDGEITPRGDKVRER